MKSTNVQKKGNVIWTVPRTSSTDAKSANVRKEGNIISAQPSSVPSSAKQTTFQKEEIVDLCSDSVPSPSRAPTNFVPLTNIVGEGTEGKGYHFSSTIDFSSSCSCSSSCNTCSSNLCSNKGASRSSSYPTSFSASIQPRSLQHSSSLSSSSSTPLSFENFGRYAKIFSSQLSSVPSSAKEQQGASRTSASSTYFSHEGTEGKGYHVNMSNKSSTVDLCSDSPPPPARAPTMFLPSANIVGEGLPSLRNIIVTETEEHEIIFPLLSGANSGNILIDKFSINMSITKFKSLAPRTWLNDEIVNFYFGMLMEGCISNNLRIHCFSTFFFVKLLRQKEEVTGYLFERVKRWTKNIDIFTLEKIFIPINITNTHWTLVFIDIVLKTIIYYDSYRHDGPYADAAIQVRTCNILFLLHNK